MNYGHLNSRISLTFSVEGQLVFTGGQNFSTGHLYKKNFPLDGQTRQVKLSSQLVNLPAGAWPFLKPPLNYVMKWLH